MARFGMVGKLVAHPGRRGELVQLLMTGTRELQDADGCELYVVSRHSGSDASLPEIGQKLRHAQPTPTHSPVPNSTFHLHGCAGT